MEKIDLTKLPDEALYYYFTHDADEETKSLAELLDYIYDDQAEITDICKRLRDGERLLAYYPGLGDKKPTGEFLGSIPDGSLYLVKD